MDDGNFIDTQYLKEQEALIDWFYLSALCLGALVVVLAAGSGYLAWRLQAIKYKSVSAQQTTNNSGFSDAFN